MKNIFIYLICLISGFACVHQHKDKQISNLERSVSSTGAGTDANKTKAGTNANFPRESKRIVKVSGPEILIRYQSTNRSEFWFKYQIVGKFTDLEVAKAWNLYDVEGKKPERFVFARLKAASFLVESGNPNGLVDATVDIGYKHYSAVLSFVNDEKPYKEELKMYFWPQFNRRGQIKCLQGDTKIKIKSILTSKDEKVKGPDQVKNYYNQLSVSGFSLKDIKDEDKDNIQEIILGTFNEDQTECVLNYASQKMSKQNQ